jgi:uncharacterized protein (TIGR00369 family)
MSRGNELSAAADPTRTRTFSWEDPAIAAALGRQMSGLEAMRAIIAGSLPPPPIARLLDIALIEADRGRVVFALEPAEWMYNVIDSVHGGVAATLLDSCMGCAVQSTLEAGAGYATGDLHVRYVRPMSQTSGRVLAQGAVVHIGSRTATAEGRLFVESDDSLLAHGTTGCVLLR